VIDSPLIAAAFPHIHLYDVDAAVAELTDCRRAGVGLVLDAMPCACGRVIDKLAWVARRSSVDVVAATGLHHDRYYGPDHWSNRVSVDALVELFVADLTDGVDRYDYTGPLVERTPYRAGVVKVATSGEELDARDQRNLEAAARASLMTGAPILTHCERGAGALAQVERLVGWGVRPESIILSHVDKSKDLAYLRDVAQTGAVLELDQALRDAALGPRSFTAESIVALVAEGHQDRIVIGTDGARRTLWASLGGAPGLAWLAAEFPSILRGAGLSEAHVSAIMGSNASAALTWRPLTARRDPR